MRRSGEGQSIAVRTCFFVDRPGQTTGSSGPTNLLWTQKRENRYYKSTRRVRKNTIQYVVVAETDLELFSVTKVLQNERHTDGAAKSAVAGADRTDLDRFSPTKFRLKPHRWCWRALRNYTAVEGA